MNLTKQAKLKELLSQLDSLDKKEVLSTDVQSLINDEVKSFSEKLNSNPSLQILQKFQQEIAGFKKDFDLKPLIKTIEDYQAEIIHNQEITIKEFENQLISKLEEYTQRIPTLPEPFDPSYLEDEIASLSAKILSKNDFNPAPLNEKIEGIKKQIEEIDTNNLQSGAELLVEIEKKINESIKQVKMDFASRLAKGGGSINQKISINGTVISTKYADFNLKNGSNVTITKVDNNTTKQVDITIASSGGGGGNSFAIGEVPSGTIDDANVTFVLANTPIAGTDAGYINRLRQDPTTSAARPVADYSISGSTITLINPVGTGGSILWDYQY